MSADQELAKAPAGEDPSLNSATIARKRRRLIARRVSAALLLTAACSRIVPGPTAVKAPAEPDGIGRTASAANAAGRTPPPIALGQDRDAERGVARRDVATHDPVPPSTDEKEIAPAAPREETTQHGAVPTDQAASAKVKAPKAASVGKKSDSRAYGLSGVSAGAAASPGAGLGRLGGGHVALAPRPAPTMALVPAQPAPAFNTEAYKNLRDNPFRLVTEAPLSTFSVDVDTASYSNMRRFVQEGRLPPADSIRTEEWVNYFGYDDKAPSDGEPIAVASELTECPWASGHELLRVALTTQAIAQERVPPRNLVFLVDVSGSMQPANKLPLLKRGLAMLARQLRPVDTLSIVVYAGASGVALPPTSGAEQGKILAALEGLESGGSTNGAEGIQLAYRLAEQQRKHGGINRVLLATDGDFNVGVTSEGELTRLIEEKRKTGVFLTVLGFGEGNLKDSTMESLADKGNGNYAYIDSLNEARKVLVHEAGATLVTVAQDVKLQLEFNPARVLGYRLVGYEDRVLADQDFNDDTKDAGDMGAGHHVTAFYEIVPVSAHMPTATPAVDPLKYQTERQPAVASSSGDLLTVKIRYKAPGGTRSLLMSRPVADHAMPLARSSENLRFGAAVAEFALALRGAPGVGVAQLGAARSLAMGALGADPLHERREFVALMDRASQIPKN